MVIRSRALCALSVVVLELTGGGAAQASPSTTATAPFGSSGAYSFTVPVGVSSITVTAIGAAGGACGSPAAPGGEGASVSAIVSVSSGEHYLLRAKSVPPLGLEPRTFGLKDAPLQRIWLIYGRLSADQSS
jgi:hypothetical protein